MSNASAARSSDRPTSSDSVVDPKYDDRADNRDNQALDVDPGHRRGTKERENKPADDGADDAEHDVQNDTLAAIVDELARDESGDEA